MNMVREGKESDTDFLARLIAEGFAESNEKFRIIDDLLDNIDGRLTKLEVATDEIHGRLRSVEKMQGETLGRLDSIERKQEGMLISLDETVTRREFETLVVRVDALEAAAL